MPKVLVTGGAGFLGSHICELFKSKGWDVIAYDSLTKFELSRTGYNIEKIREYSVKFLESINVNLVAEDIRDNHKLGKYAKGCDYIINCAAQPAMTISLESPGYDADVNIMGTLNVLQVARQLGVPAAICSTIHVYGNGDNDSLDWLIDANYAYSETSDDLLTGQITPLHFSKHSTEIAARSFSESFGSKIFVARLTGMYGERACGGEDHSWLSNFTIRTINNIPINIYGTDKQIRDMLYVRDAARVFYEWFENGQSKPGTYNIGGGIPCILSLKRSLEILSELTGNTQKINHLPSRKGDLWYFVSDTTKAFNSFGWKPTITPDIGIPKLIKWVSDNHDLFIK
jgi:CDP-paratose 2-epimerase